MEGFFLYESPVGLLKITYDHGAVTSLLTAQTPEPGGVPNALTNTVCDQLTAYFNGTPTAFDFPYTLHGTPFQQKVWAALTAIPYGETCSYRDIAAAVGNPKACRAVGMANHRNPILIAVPCHRVVGADGSLVGYGGGLPMKRALLALESGRTDWQTSAQER